MFGHLREKCKYLNPKKVDTTTPANLDDVKQQVIVEGEMEKKTHTLVNEGSNPAEGVSKTHNSEVSLIDS